jgi:broad specificity phosphatase PhoE
LRAQKIYLIRHGQTDYNLRGIVQGSGVDASLNDRGRAQALAFYEAYRHVTFDRIYTSRLKRSQESVQPFVERGASLDSMVALNEISWGAKEGQHITPEEDAYYHWMLQQWQQGNTSLPIEGGESPEAVAVRQQEFIAQLVARDQDRQVLVCMHGRAMRILLCQLLGYPLRSMDLFEHENLCLYLLHYNGKQFSVESFNDTAHLNSLPKVDPSVVMVPK